MVYLYTNNYIPDMKFQVFFIQKFCNLDNALFAEFVQQHFNNSLRDAEIWLTLCCVRILMLSLIYNQLYTYWYPDWMENMLFQQLKLIPTKKMKL
jgi:hypothetical protein